MQCKEKASWRKQGRVAPTLRWLVGCWVLDKEVAFICWKLTGGRCDWIGLMHGSLKWFDQDVRVLS